MSGLRNWGTKRRGIRVFCYHGIVTRKADPLLERNFNIVADFRSHVQFLKRYRVLSLIDLLSEVSRGTAEEKPAAVITFDDGYANNLLAAEILVSSRLPFSVFVPTGVVGKENSIWPVDLSLLLLHGAASHVEVLDVKWDLGSRRQREKAFEAIRCLLKSMSAVNRQHAMDCIRQQFPKGETQRLLAEFPSMQIMSWDEVGQLSAAGVEIGSHGVYHELHHANQPEDVRLSELEHSKSELERRTGQACQFFAFPNGDFTNESPAELEGSGYSAGFTTQPRTVVAGTNPYLLPRLTSLGSLRDFARKFVWE